MADTIDWNIVLRLAVQGAKGSKTELEGVQKAAEGLAREGKNVEKGLEQTTRAVNRAGSGAASATVDYNKFAQGSTSLRYANYDVAQTMFTVAAGFAAVGTGAVVAAAQYESAFTAVERTSGLAGEQAAGLREELLQLTREIPQTFAEISSLASRGAQLGIDSSEIADFTEVVAQFVATSDTVTLDQAVEAFGRISNLLGDTNFNALGSAITLVGVNAAATEGQIVKTTQELAPFGAAVGLASDEVIALAAAVSSLGQPPERARSAFLTLQRVVDGAVTGMNDNLGAFSQLLGMTEAETANLWKQDPGQFIQSFVTALGGVENLTVAFDQLGINERRAVQVFQALAADSRNAAGGMSVLSSAFADANQGYVEGTELQRQYALIVDDLASKWQILMNAVMEFAAAAGTAAMPALKALIDGLSGVIQGAAQLIQSPVGQFFARMAGAAIVLVTAFAAFRGTIALATASMVGLNFAARALGGASTLAAIRGLLASFGLIKTGADGATASTFRLRGALLALGRATLVLGVLQVASELLFNFGGVLEYVQQPMHGLIDLSVVLAGRLAALARGLAGFVSNIPGVGSGLAAGFNVAAGALENVAKVAPLAHRALDTTVAKFNKTEDGSDALANAFNGALGDTDDFADGLDGLGDSAAGAAAEVRTLTDYAGDLSSVFSRAFEIRFNPQATLDQIASSFQAIRDRADESAKNIRTLKAEIQGLESDLNIQQRFLSIAIEYQDYDRAQAIQANIAKIQEDLAGKTEQLSKEQAANSTALLGNSAAAIANRETLRGLVQQYQEHVSALAASGLSAEELARRTEELRQDFINQATQLGFNRGELGLYEQAFYDVKVAIDNVPRNITVAFNADPALQALNEFAARAQASMSAAGTSLGTTLGQNLGASLATETSKAVSEMWSKIRLQGVDQVGPLASGYVFSGGSGRDRQGGGYAFRNGFAGGGYTGAGGKYEPAGIVHRGEYVVPKHQVNQRTGLPYADALGRLQKGMSGRTGYAGGGYVSGGGGMGVGRIESFGPMAQQQLMAALQQQLNLDSKPIAQGVARQNAHETNVGAF